MEELHVSKEFSSQSRQLIQFVDHDVVETYITSKPFKQIILALQSGPKTVMEIFEEIHQVVENVSKVTIYRYVQLLRNVGLVEEIGGKKSSLSTGRGSLKILYDITALFFVPKFHEEELWETKSGNNSIFLFSKMIQHHFRNLTPSLDDLRIKLFDITKSLNKSLFHVIQKLNESPELQSTIKNLLSQIDYNSTIFFYELLGILHFMFQKDYLSIMNCENVSEEEININFTSNNSNRKQKETTEHNQDIIDPEYEIEFIQPIAIDLLKKFYGDPNYRAIIRLLLKKPMTLAEIYDSHQEAILSIKTNTDCEIKHDKVFIDDEEQENIQIPKKKSKKSVWRYIDQLKQSNIIVEAGCRIDQKHGKRGPKTQLLYARKSFYFREIIPVPKEWKEISMAIGNVLALSFELSFDKKDKFYQILKNLFQTKQYLLINIFNKFKDTNVIKLISKYSLKEYKAFGESVETVEWLIALELDNMIDKIKQCFN